MYELLSYMVLMYAFYDECATLEEMGDVSVLEIFEKAMSIMYAPYVFTLKTGLFADILWLN